MSTRNPHTVWNSIKMLHVFTSAMAYYNKNLKRNYFRSLYNFSKINIHLFTVIYHLVIRVQGYTIETAEFNFGSVDKTDTILSILKVLRTYT